MAMEQLYGDFDASYNELQGWIAAMREHVPGTVIELQTRSYDGPNDQLQSRKRIFHRMFWTFDQYVRAFPHCKPFVQVDGTWLYGKYTQILLLAVAQDGNRNVLPIAFTIVDKENMESWEFFLTNLRRYVISNDNICIISDRRKGLIAAIRRSGVPCVRARATHFRQRMARLESDMEGQTNTSFRQWLGTMEPWLATLMPRMGQQQVNQMEAGHVFVEGIRDAMVVNCRMARSMTVEVYSRHNETFRVTETIGRRPSIPPRSYGVDLRNRRCDCRRFQTLHFPCAHVVAACAKVGLNVEQFIDEVYTIERTLHVWENEFPMLPDLSTWEVPPTTFELVPDIRLRRNLKGRPQSSRIHNEMDIREKSDGNLCGVCRLPGHNRSKCPL
ncbi:uncharacterized protein LOC128041751 [Gossypium raimondii]|uniref:uncharacterized protein LOC128041751 n=1 Tax=Gossypium raimondii TaxID=29730 RepID=UPI00227B6C94|nr:uncharacterized protein LOC128041751 [Gossypium raimondii]